MTRLDLDRLPFGTRLDRASMNRYAYVLDSPNIETRVYGGTWAQLTGDDLTQASMAVASICADLGISLPQPLFTVEYGPPPVVVETRQVTSPEQEIKTLTACAQALEEISYDPEAVARVIRWLTDRWSDERAPTST